MKPAGEVLHTVVHEWRLVVVNLLFKPVRSQIHSMLSIPLFVVHTYAHGLSDFYPSLLMFSMFNFTGSYAHLHARRRSNTQSSAVTWNKHLMNVHGFP